jgi:ActR/RegA family two-component response regulator
MSEVVRLKGLLFSTDAQVLDVMNQVLDNFEIETEVCHEPASALDAVTTTKVDTLIMDWTGSDESIQILSAMRNSQQNAKSTVLAMVNGNSEMQAATHAGANFIVYKPMNVDQATRFLRAAYGNMLLQRRRAIRCSVDIPVVASVLRDGHVEGKITNLSVLGLAFICEHPIGIDQQLAIGFKLPETSVHIRVTGRVVNEINPDGRTRVGVCFSFVPPEEFDLLEEWITNHLPRLPNRLMSSDNRQAAN